MADVTLPATTVAVAGGTANHGTSGEAILAGKAVYRKAADNLIYNADSNTAAADADVLGIALNSAPAASQPIKWAETGDLTVSGLTRGTVYVLADTADLGLLMPAADLLGSDWVTIIGLGVSATVLRLGITASGIQV